VVGQLAHSGCDADVHRAVRRHIHASGSGHASEVDQCVGRRDPLVDLNQQIGSTAERHRPSVCQVANRVSD
jgi:hypothetical protein